MTRAEMFINKTNFELGSIDTAIKNAYRTIGKLEEQGEDDKKKKLAARLLHLEQRKARFQEVYEQVLTSPNAEEQETLFEQLEGELNKRRLKLLWARRRL